jgi:hypothetical protein
VRRIDVNGQIGTVAGKGASGYFGDGHLATVAELNLATNPLEGIGEGLAVDFTPLRSGASSTGAARLLGFCARVVPDSSPESALH